MMDSKEILTTLKSFLAGLLVILVSLPLIYVLFLVWRYFAPMFNLPMLTFWEVILLKIAVDILSGKIKLSLTFGK